MREVVIDEGADGAFEAWRAAARALLAEGVPPEAVAWRAAGGDADAGVQLDALPAEAPPHAASRIPHPACDLPPPAPDLPRAAVPRRFLVLAAAVACHADPGRWALLYRALWRIARDAPRLLEDHADADVARLARLERAVRREVHKCHAFVRFREVRDDAGMAYVAWFEPTHDVLARAAPFFARRFPNMRWAILSPRRTVRWEGGALVLGPGVGRDAAPADDALEGLWRTYYTNVFNPARVKVRAMRAEMPQRYWAHLPEAALIPQLVREAPGRVRAMVGEREGVDAGGGMRDAGGASPAPHSARRVPAPRVAPSAEPEARSAEPEARSAEPEARSAEPEAPSVLRIPHPASRIRTGTASWTDPTLLVPGLFYPEGVRTPEQRLRFYASRFPLVEVDSTYYALPTRRVAELWAARTPPGFVFDVKAHALLTGHPVEPRRLPRALRELLPPSLAGANRVAGADVPAAAREAAWTLFLDALAPLVAAGKLGAILLQWPRDFRPTRAAAAALAEARARLAALDAAGVVGAVELRHRDWFADGVRARTLALLERLELAHVIVDAPPGFASSVPWVPAATHPRLAVVRLHGRRVETWERPVAVVSERYRYLYDSAELAGFVPDIADVARRVQGVHVVFNNCHGDYGTRNASEMAELLARRDALRRALARAP